MIRVLIAIALLLQQGMMPGPGTPHSAGGGGVTWSLINDTFTDTTTGCTLGTNTCTLTIPSTSAGDVLLASTYTVNNLTISSMSSGGTWAHCSNCAVFNSTIPAATDYSYVLSATGGVTSVTFTFSGSTATYGRVEITEIRRSTGSATLDTSGNANDTVNCTACTGVALTLTGSADAIFQFLNDGQTISSVNSPYTWSAEQSQAYWLAATTGTAPIVNQSPTGQFAFSAIAFK